MAEVIDFKGRTEGARDAESIACQALRDVSAAIFKALTPITTPVLHANKAGTHPRISSAGDRLDRINGGPGK